MRVLGKLGFLLLAALIVGVAIEPAISQEKKEDKKEDKKDKKEDKKEELKDKKEDKKDKKEDKKEVVKFKGQLPAGWGKIGLTDDQKQNVYKIQSKYGTKVDELKSEMAKLKSEEKKEIEKVLTDDQRKKLIEAATGIKGDK